MVESIRDTPTLRLSLPEWVGAIAHPGDLFPDREGRMRLAIELAVQNLQRRTGGPFGAGVFERDTGRVVALGVNLVEPAACSIAHAEAVAVALAQQVRKTHDLAAPGFPPVELVC